MKCKWNIFNKKFCSRLVVRLLFVLEILAICLFAFASCGIGQDQHTNSGRVDEIVIDYGLDAEEITAVREFYSGRWYGYLVISNITGYDLEEFSAWNAVVTFEFVSSADMPVAYVQILDAEDQSRGLGNFSVQIGADDSWSVADARILSNGVTYIAHSFKDEFEKLLAVNGQAESEDGSFTYGLYIRPWGMKWDDVREKYPERIPPDYDSWYLPQLDG